MAIITVHILFTIVATVWAATINQRQSGDMNIHVNVKDVKIVALLKDSKEEYVDYDYAYDYSEMTIKPQNSTTAKPLNITTELNLDKPRDNTTTESIVEITPLAPIKNTSLAPQQETTVAPLFNSSTEMAPIEPSSTEVPNPASLQTNTTSTGCKKGFSVNKKGECELKIPTSSTNALLKLVKLSQKLKLRREN